MAIINSVFLFYLLRYVYFPSRRGAPRVLEVDKKHITAMQPRMVKSSKRVAEKAEEDSQDKVSCLVHILFSFSIRNIAH